VTNGRGRFLHHLLVAPLDRAFALAQIDDVAVLVAEQLDLDMARALDELLDEHAVVAEAGQPLALGRLEAFAHVAFGPGQPHPLAAAAGRGLHHHRIADLAGDPHRIVGRGDVAEEAGHDVDARRLGELLGLDLVAHRRDRVRRRADKGDAVLGQQPRESSRARREAVAGMHRLRAGLLGREQDQLGLEIALRRRRRPKPHRLVRHLHMRRPRVRVGIDGDRLDAHPLGGADDAAGDLATIGDQDFVEHRTGLS
jgi:hypothetical protein